MVMEYLGMAVPSEVAELAIGRSSAPDQGIVALHQSTLIPGSGLCKNHSQVAMRLGWVQVIQTNPPTCLHSMF
jgi:hypothetical protein